MEQGLTMCLIWYNGTMPNNAPVKVHKDYCIYKFQTIDMRGAWPIFLPPLFYYDLIYERRCSPYIFLFTLPSCLNIDVLPCPVFLFSEHSTGLNLKFMESELRSTSIGKMYTNLLHMVRCTWVYFYYDNPGFCMQRIQICIFVVQKWTYIHTY